MKKRNRPHAEINGEAVSYASESEKHSKKAGVKPLDSDDKPVDKSTDSASQSTDSANQSTDHTGDNTDSALNGRDAKVNESDVFAEAVATLADATGVIEIPAEIKGENPVDDGLKGESSAYKKIGNTRKERRKRHEKDRTAVSDSEKQSGDENDENKEQPVTKKIRKHTIAEIDDQVKEIIDDALDESAENLGLTDEQPTVQSVSLSQIISAVFGVVVLGFAIFGMVCAVNIFSDYTQDRKNMTTQREYFQRLILPLSASDAPTFDGVASLNSDVIITAACWDVILNPSSTYAVQSGNYIVSYLEIDTRVNKLFGSGLEYTHSAVGDEELLFEYNEETGMYTIPMTPRAIAYFPTIDSLDITENGYSAVVSYRAPVTQWIAGSSTPDKTMVYTFIGDGFNYTISSLAVEDISNIDVL